MKENLSNHDQPSQNDQPSHDQPSSQNDDETEIDENQPSNEDQPSPPSNEDQPSSHLTISQLKQIFNLIISQLTILFQEAHLVHSDLRFLMMW